ncbi:hypothetical protein ElyMa_005304800 [Elysia marginata]|uniref:Secreted protein n=1 Tax=Elysia marginata TaxID=1093978 RepID=A0AAV4K0K9_9GAST|nr:hypothetical protein ElyMa_005304800 [Elysia marginata]
MLQSRVCFLTRVILWAHGGYTTLTLHSHLLPPPPLPLQKIKSGTEAKAANILRPFRIQPSKDEKSNCDTVERTYEHSGSYDQRYFFSLSITVAPLSPLLGWTRNGRRMFAA